MMKIIWSERAKKELQNIFLYLAPLNKRSAVKIHNRIVTEAMHLKCHPFLGAIEPFMTESNYTFRKLIVKKRYKIIYYIEDQTIQILSIWDCNRNPEDMTKEIK